MVVVRIRATGGLFLCGKSHFRATGDMYRGVKVGEDAAVRIVVAR